MKYMSTTSWAIAIIHILNIQVKFCLEWLPEDLPNDKSTLFHVMVWYRQVTSVTWTSVNQDHRLHMAQLSHNEFIANFKIVIQAFPTSFDYTFRYLYIHDICNWTVGFICQWVNRMSHQEIAENDSLSSNKCIDHNTTSIFCEWIY